MKRSLKQRQRGFTLAEIMIAIGIASLILMTVMTMFITITRNTVGTNSQMNASADANLAMEQVIETSREAGLAALPGETGFTYPNGRTVADYSTTVSGSTVYTAMMLTYPAAGPNLTFSGTTNAVPTFDRTTPGANVIFYRADITGTPNPTTGLCVWEVGTANGVAVNKAIMSSVASAPDAVQFMRPSSALANEVALKIVSGYFSPFNNTTTSEASNGHSTTTLTGKCVLIRNNGTGAWATQPSLSNSGHWNAY